LDPKCARVYCLTPDRLPAPTIAADRAATRTVAPNDPGPSQCGSLTLKVGRESPSDARQLLRLTVTDSQGREREELMQTVWVGEKPMDPIVPLALNDPTGIWKLTATDVISGQRATCEVEVR